MSRIIPNQESWIGFATAIANVQAPTAAEIAAAVALTDLLVSVTAATTGNTVPAPDLSTLFEPSVPGTAASQFSADFYRDDEADTAWITLPRNTVGFFVISWFGGKGTDFMPVAADKCDVWPVRVASRSMAAIASNTVETFTVTCSVPSVPGESVTVSA